MRRFSTGRSRWPRPTSSGRLAPPLKQYADAVERSRFMNLRFIRHALLSVLLVFTFVIVSPPTLNASQKSVHVKGYTKKDGTEVKPHDRKAPKSESTSDDKKTKTK